MHADEKRSPEGCNRQEAQEMMRTRKNRIAFCALSATILVLSSQLSAYRPFVYGVDDASSKLAQADNAVTQAFVAVEAAQEAGANVSALLKEVNDANAVLAEAHTASRSGDNETASLKSDQAFNTVQNVFSEAESLERSAKYDSQARLVWTALLSSLGLSLLFVACLFGWRYLKKRYVRQALEMQPAKVDQA